MKIFAALRDDLNEGLVWLKRPDLPSRCVVRIKNPNTSKVVYCEALQIDDNFLNEYNNDDWRFKIGVADDPIVLSGWFRTRLGAVVTQHDYAFEISPSNGHWGRLRACMDNPQVVVRVAAWLGVIGVALGIIGVILGAVSLVLAIGS